MGDEQDKHKQKAKWLLWLACVAGVVAVAISVFKHIDSAGNKDESSSIGSSPPAILGANDTESWGAAPEVPSKDGRSGIFDIPFGFQGTVEDAIGAATDEIEDILINERRLGVSTPTQYSIHNLCPPDQNLLFLAMFSQSLSGSSFAIASEVVTVVWI